MAQSCRNLDAGSCVDTEEPASPTTARRQAWGEVDADMMHRTPCFGGRTQLYSVAFADMFTLFRFKVVYSRVVPIFVQIMETSRHLKVVRSGLQDRPARKTKDRK